MGSSHFQGSMPKGCHLPTLLELARKVLLAADNGRSFINGVVPGHGNDILKG